MTLGDVYWADLPDATGHVQQGSRPVVVFQDDVLMKPLPTVVVIPLTGTLAATRFPGTVLIRSNPQNGLNKDSVALVFQIRVIDRADFRRHAGNVGLTVMGQLYAAMDRITGRPRPTSGTTP